MTEDDGCALLSGLRRCLGPLRSLLGPSGALKAVSDGDDVAVTGQTARFLETLGSAQPAMRLFQQALQAIEDHPSGGRGTFTVLCDELARVFLQLRRDGVCAVRAAEAIDRIGAELSALVDGASIPLSSIVLPGPPNAQEAEGGDDGDDGDDESDIAWFFSNEKEPQECGGAHPDCGAAAGAPRVRGSLSEALAGLARGLDRGVLELPGGTAPASLFPIRELCARPMSLPMAIAASGVAAYLSAGEQTAAAALCSASTQAHARFMSGGSFLSVVAGCGPDMRESKIVARAVAIDLSPKGLAALSDAIDVRKKLARPAGDARSARRGSRSSSGADPDGAAAPSSWLRPLATATGLRGLAVIMGDLRPGAEGEGWSLSLAAGVHAERAVRVCDAGAGGAALAALLDRGASAAAAFASRVCAAVDALRVHVLCVTGAADAAVASRLRNRGVLLVTLVREDHAAMLAAIGGAAPVADVGALREAAVGREPLVAELVHGGWTGEERQRFAAPAGGDAKRLGGTVARDDYILLRGAPGAGGGGAGAAHLPAVLVAVAHTRWMADELHAAVRGCLRRICEALGEQRVVVGGCALWRLLSLRMREEAAGGGRPACELAASAADEVSLQVALNAGATLAEAALWQQRGLARALAQVARSPVASLGGVLAAAGAAWQSPRREEAWRRALRGDESAPDLDSALARVCLAASADAGWALGGARGSDRAAALFDSAAALRNGASAACRLVSRLGTCDAAELCGA